MTDPIADLLTRIRNGLMAGHDSVTIPYSKMKEQLAKIIKEKGIVTDVSITKNNKFPEIKIDLDGTKKETKFKRVSKPGQRIYLKHDRLRKIKNGLGFSIISTSRGLMTGEEARKNKLGGEVLCEIA